MIPFHFTNVTWGVEHTRLYLEISLPSQLAPGNIPALAERPGTVYKLYTTVEDAAVIKQSPAFEKLISLVSTEIIYIDTGTRPRPKTHGASEQATSADAGPPYEFHATNHDARVLRSSGVFSQLSPQLKGEISSVADKAPPPAAHTLLSQCHSDANREAGKVGAAVVFLAPDIVLADGAFANLARLIDEGKRAVITVGTRVALETFMPAFMKRYQRGQLQYTVNARELTRLALEHLHPCTTGVFWPPRLDWPSNMFWPVGKEGLVGRCFHMHPIVVVASPQAVDFASTIDDDYVLRAYPREEDVYVIEDSDEFCTYEISSVNHIVGTPQEKPLDSQRIGFWAMSFANKLHRRLVKHKIHIHCGEFSPLWDDVQARCDQDISSVIEWTAFFDRWFPHAQAVKARSFKTLHAIESAVWSVLRFWPIRRVVLAFGTLFTDDPRGLAHRIRTVSFRYGMAALRRSARSVIRTVIAVRLWHRKKAASAVSQTAPKPAANKPSIPKPKFADTAPRHEMADVT